MKMKGTVSYSIVDVFAQGKYTGNPLAVFKNAELLSDEEMQQIAREINFSETTYIYSNVNDDSYQVRIFTPNEEIPFAGHPTLGTAFVIQSEIIQKPVQQLTLRYKSGKISVTFNQETGVIWMEQGKPRFGKQLEVSKLAEVLSIQEDLIDQRFPVQEVSTGLPVIIVPLVSLEVVKKVKINLDKYYSLIETCEAKAITVFCSETVDSDNDVHVRDFGAYYGIPEDAATGSANGCLAAYLSKYNYFQSKEINLRSEQGYEIGRPSLLFLSGTENKILVGGYVEKVAVGEWVIRHSGLS